MEDEVHIIDQVRALEGKLFQSERLMALYLDVKAVLLQQILGYLRKATDENSILTSEICLLNEEFVASQLKLLASLSPEGSKEFHSTCLHECLKSMALLLWPTQSVLVARPKVSTLFRGMCTRMCANDQVRTGKFLLLDPIKQDFVVREVFRRTLVNDCLHVFDNDAQINCESSLDKGSLSEQPPSRPQGAHSVLGGHDDDELPDSASAVEAEEVDEQQVEVLCLQEVKESGKDDDAKTEVTRATRATRATQSRVFTRPIEKQDEDAKTVGTRKSSASNSTMYTTNSILRKPLNVRKITISETDTLGQ